MLKFVHVCNYFCDIQAKERLSSQTEEWTNMINRQVEEEIRMFEEHAAQVSCWSEEILGHLFTYFRPHMVTLEFNWSFQILWKE